MNYGDAEHAADYAAEMARDDDWNNMTDAQREEYIAEQNANADYAAECRAEHGMNFGIGWHLEEPDYRA